MEKLSVLMRLVLLGAHLCCQGAQSELVLSAPSTNESTNAFPPLAQIFQGRTFATESERDVFFLRAVHDRYPHYWNPLLTANINLSEYTVAGSKLLRFVEELGVAMNGTDDRAACTNLALLTGGEAFYANTNVYHPEIQRAAAKALISIGPTGCAALASSFTPVHYRTDPDSLEQLAKEIGKIRRSETVLVDALTATAFEFCTTNGGTYPDCTRTAVENLLHLDSGQSAVRAHLTSERVLEDPGRFQAVIEAIATARISGLRTNLVALQTAVANRLAALTNSPGGYTDNLQGLDKRLARTMETLQSTQQSQSPH